jgi:hypothetical protein
MAAANGPKALPAPTDIKIRSKGLARKSKQVTAKTTSIAGDPGPAGE